MDLSETLKNYIFATRVSGGDGIFDVDRYHDAAFQLLLRRREPHQKQH